MTDFARWLGRLGAALAALLAVVWVIEASPPDDAARQRMQQACMARVSDMTSPFALRDPGAARLAADAHRACWQVGTGWDQPVLMKGLGAGVVAVVLLLLAAVVGGRAEAADPDLSPAELAFLAEEERRRHLAETGQDLPPWQARDRALMRHRIGAKLGRAER